MCSSSAISSAVAGGLVGRRQRMDVGELGPGDRDHLAGRIELHRARAQRDHRAVERQVLVGERAHVAQHLVLAVVRVEYRMSQKRRRAPQRRRGSRPPDRHRFAIERVDVGAARRRSATAPARRRAWSSRRARCQPRAGAFAEIAGTERAQVDAGRARCARGSWRRRRRRPSACRSNCR